MGLSIAGKQKGAFSNEVSSVRFISMNWLAWLEDLSLYDQDVVVLNKEGLE